MPTTRHHPEHPEDFGYDKMMNVDTLISKKKNPLAYLFSKGMTDGVALISRLQKRSMERRYWDKVYRKAMKEPVKIETHYFHFHDHYD